MAQNTLAGLVLDDPAAGIFRVRRSAFVLPEIFEAEKRLIFDKAWLYLGHESEVPRRGDFRLRNMVGRPLVLCRGDDDKVRVFINSCAHRGAEFCQEAFGNKRVFRCPYHSWTYKNTGELIDVLAEDGYGGGYRRADFNLREVPRATCYRGFIFICFDRDAVPLEIYLGGARIYLDYVADQSPDGKMEIIQGSQLYSARANWKLLVENTIDFYHTVPLHRTYFRFLEKSGSDISGGVAGNGYDLGGGHAVVSFTAGWGRPVARWQPSWGEAERERIAKVRADFEARLGPERARMVCEVDRNLCLFPNLLINDIMATVIRQVNPVSVDYMEITQWAIAPAGESPDSRARRLQAFNTFLGPGGFATPDDIEAFEGCQRGFAAHKEAPWSDYSRGYFGEAERPDHLGQSSYERQLRAFYRRWGEMLGAGREPSVRSGLAAAAQ
jgi:phenylpropionate dioxygenase-like ring-hydroxylating dioxygenase large terminal subunit